MKKRPETEIAAAAVAWLEGDGWDVYQEVKPYGTNRIADVVGTKGGLVAVVECKVVLGAAVCMQALRWRHETDLLWICVDREPVDYDVRHFYSDYMRWKGIGLLEARGIYGEGVRVAMITEERARSSNRLLDAVRPEHKTFAAAGSPNGGVWSPFKDSSAKIRDYLAEHPGVGASEVVKALGKLHWANDASARSGILHGASKGFMAGVRIEQDGRRLKLYAEGR